MNAPAPHPISLEAVLFTKTFVQAMSGHELRADGQRAIAAQPENSIDVKKVEDRPNVYAATMTSVLNAAKDTAVPYYFEMECLALLRADDSLSEEEALRGITITAHSVLYGAIRETVAWMTARQPFGPFLLGLSILRPTPANAGSEPKPEV